MKRIVISFVVILVVVCVAVVMNSYASQSPSSKIEICPGTGVCCGTLYLEDTNMDLVKDPDQGGIIITNPDPNPTHNPSDN